MYEIHSSQSHHMKFWKLVKFLFKMVERLQVSQKTTFPLHMLMIGNQAADFLAPQELQSKTLPSNLWTRSFNGKVKIWWALASTLLSVLDSKYISLAILGFDTFFGRIKRCSPWPSPWDSCNCFGATSRDYFNLSGGCDCFLIGLLYMESCNTSVIRTNDHSFLCPWIAGVRCICSNCAHSGWHF